VRDENDLYRIVMDRMKMRNELFRLICRIADRDLKRLTGILAELTDADLKLVAGYAESLAYWASPEQLSGDAPIPK